MVESSTYNLVHGATTTPPLSLRREDFGPGVLALIVEYFAFIIDEHSIAQSHHHRAFRIALSLRLSAPLTSATSDQSLPPREIACSQYQARFCAPLRLQTVSFLHAIVASTTPSQQPRQLPYSSSTVGLQSLLYTRFRFDRLRLATLPPSSHYRFHPQPLIIHS